MPVGKYLLEGILFEDTADIEVSKVPDRNEGRGVVPSAVFDGQRPDLGLDVLEELVKMQCLSTFCGEGEVLQVSKLGEDKLSSSIGRSDSKS